ncbi:TIGR02678 family protein [Knoellia aerolata]|uniref:TIGR02678 family protein n=1 Tax=Knoellia aerolata DSM 18566 TaxID=1385519 RepID=A0A0A0JWH9_9MICO|nr:TIGR02678 family protein [Knoellia aerolata]KGN41805.1 hypothetical protein N801_04560 [Knoellia aerolata DSM 18566]
MTPTTVERPRLADDPIEVAQRVEAARQLLLHPLMAATEANRSTLRLIRRHQAELTRLFADGAGYRLHVDPNGARLFKAGLGRDSTRPLRRRSGTPFTPRAYALLALVLAALTRSKSQLLVDELVAQVRSTAVDAGIDLDLDGITDRRALNAALLALVDLGILVERDGDLDHWAEKRTQSLLDVRRELLSLMVAAPLSSATSAGDLLDRAALPSAVGGARIAVRRRLLESPILTVDDLTEDQSEWWRRNRNRESEWFRDHFGLEVELRAEGALAVDPDDELTDVSFPGRGSTRHLALLVLEALTEQAPAVTSPGKAWHGIPIDSARVMARGIVSRWAEVLRRDQREAPDAAVDEAFALLESMGLLRRSDDPRSMEVHAAASRYAPAPVIVEKSSTGELSLFDTQDEDD